MGDKASDQQPVVVDPTAAIDAMPDAAKSVDGAATLMPETTPPDEKLAVRVWFESMTPRDRAVAVGFMDGPFLATCMQLLASPSSTTRRRDDESLLATRDDAPNLPFGACVDVNDLEVTIRSYEQEFGKGSWELNLSTVTMKEAEAPYSVASSTDKLKSTVDRVVSRKTQKEGGGGADVEEVPKLNNTPAEADVFRIRPEDDRQELATGCDSAEKADDPSVLLPEQVSPPEIQGVESVEAAAPASATTKDSPAIPTIAETMLSATTTATTTHHVVEGGDYPIPTLVRDLFEHFCVVFPSVIHFTIPKNNVKGHAPFFTLQPTILQHKAGEDALRALDAAIQTASPSSSFLSPDFLASAWLEQPPTILEMWIHRLKALANNKPTVPLFLVLVVRMEIAAYDCFRNDEKNITGAVKHNAGGKAKTRGRRPQKRFNTSTTCGVSTRMLNILGSRGGTFGSVSCANYALAVRASLAPLAALGVVSADNDGKGVTLDNLLLTPFRWLVRAMFTKPHVPSLKSLDAAWKECIESVKKQLDVSDALAVVKASPADLKMTAAPAKEEKKQQPDTGDLKPSSQTQASPLQESAGVSGVNRQVPASWDWMDDSFAVTPPTGTKKKKKSKKKRKKNKSTIVNAPTQEVRKSAPDSEGLERDVKEESGHEKITEEPKAADVEAKKSNGKPKGGDNKVRSVVPKQDGGERMPKTAAKTQPVAHKSKDQVIPENDMKQDRSSGVDADCHPNETMHGSDEPEVAQISNTETSEPVKAAEVTNVAAVETCANLASESDNHTLLPSEESGVELSRAEEEQNAQAVPADGINSIKAEENGSQIDSTSDRKSDIMLSHVEGLGTVVVAPVSVESSNKAPSKGEPSTADSAGESVEDCHDDWETVEVKGRGNRKKPGDRSNRLNGGSASQSHNNGPKKPKPTRTKESRTRIANRKIVKQIIFSVLDTVDEEVRKRRRVVSKQPSASTCGGSSAGTARQESSPRSVGLADVVKRGTTLRDIVIGKQASCPYERSPQPGSKTCSRPTVGAASPESAATTKGNGKNDNEPPTKRSKGQGQAGADQNTAATVPETVSAVSDTDGNRGLDSRRNALSTELARSDSSSGDSEAPQEGRAKPPSQTGKAVSPPPPLPTLLSPGNANSSSSSVCSSLEAPHAGHTRHHTSSSDEKGVGYHLLDVCDRLSKDMHEFMKRRAAALSSRRMERGALLGALQESVSLLWPSLCHVEMYGSCATMLDLPSSDLDVVVCGLDREEVPVATSPAPQKSLVSFAGSPVESRITDDALPEAHMNHHLLSAPQYVPKHVNADRVVRLAAELEKQPWAVHVKAIPTASVPVVKVLADPSRLPGFAAPRLDESTWIPQAYQAEAPRTSDNPETSAATRPLGCPSSAVQGPQSPVSQFQPPAWRGADVINGLLSLDITFEGPEHGGIGSTEFSARVVQDACNDTGLHAEQTPIVQAIMVLKELLAQRRLNEPFSGGLSSYALLLLVLAVMCERKVIREELDRVEKQRRLVAAGGGSSDYGSASNGKVADLSVPEHRINVMTADDKVEGSTDNAMSGHQPVQGNRSGGSAVAGSRVQPAKSPREPSDAKQAAKSNHGNPSKGVPAKPLSPVPAKSPGSSWANVAKGQKRPGPERQGAALGNKSEVGAAPQTILQSPQKPSSFADAVARMAVPHLQQQQPGRMNTAAAAKSSGGTQSQKLQCQDNDTKTQKRQQEAAKTETATAVPSLPKLADSSVSAKMPGRGEHLKHKLVVEEDNARKIEADEETRKLNNYSSVPVDSGIVARESLFPHGFNDVIEVLCSGETTAGKLLMHFLLFYGQHFDAQATAIDISGKHPREPVPGQSPYSHLSPYIQRRSAGTIDPITGMLTVDPIVVYDPLEGAENNNVARRCFLWSNVRWVFAQSYMTLSSAVELNPTPPTTPGAGTRGHSSSSSRRTSPGHQGQSVATQNAAWKGPYNPDDKASPFDPMSPLLELLLSF